MPRVFEDYSDKRNKAWCIHCGDWLGASPVTRDHTPSKVLLDRPLPDNLAVTPICVDCNQSFSLDEEYFAAFLSVVFSGTTEPASQVNPRVGRALQRNSKLRALLESQRETQSDLFETDDSRWFPDDERFRRVILKNARAHLFHENGEPMLDEPNVISYAPLAVLSEEQTSNFFSQDLVQPWCEVGSRWNTRVLCGDTFDSDGFLVVQPNVYRFRIEGGGSGIKSIIREYLATSVFW